MLNESLCDSDKQKQAHMTNIDQKLKKLFSFKRLSVDIFIKLEALRDEDETHSSTNILKTLKKAKVEEENFFFDSEQDKGFQEVTMNEEGDMTVDAQRYEKDCERGYFLQPIYAQTIKRKIHLYDDLVGEMLAEFHSRVIKKRKLIEAVKLRCKEVALRDTMVICDRCHSDLAPLKTLDYESHELHYAKCVFGTFKRVEAADALGKEAYADDQDFVSLYSEIQQEEEAALRAQGKPVQEFGFCACRKGHIVGIVKGQKYYLTDISQVYLMFPNGVKEQWDSRFWMPKYKKAIELEGKLNFQRAEMQKRGYKKDVKGSFNKLMRCDLCQVDCGDPDDFIMHCKKDVTHRELEQKFTDETFDFLFVKSEHQSSVAIKQ
jgi:hypothetical protein